MDFISHGLWGGIAFGRKNKKFFLWSFLIGIAPDVFSFGILMVVNFVGFLRGSSSNWHGGSGAPDASQIPEFVHVLYNVTHSLVVFSLVFLLVWFIFKKPFWPLAAWGLHILVDIPTHSAEFFPTPFLWPFSNFYISGINWSNPWIFFSDWILIFLAYGAWFLRRKIKDGK